MTLWGYRFSLSYKTIPQNVHSHHSVPPESLVVSANTMKNFVTHSASPSAILGCGTSLLDANQANPDCTFACSCWFSFTHGITHKEYTIPNWCASSELMCTEMYAQCLGLVRPLSTLLEVAMSVSQTQCLTTYCTICAKWHSNCQLMREWLDNILTSKWTCNAMLHIPLVNLAYVRSNKMNDSIRNGCLSFCSM